MAKNQILFSILNNKVRNLELKKGKFDLFICPEIVEFF